MELWNLDSVVGNSISETYQLLVNLVPHFHSPVLDLNWHKNISLKVYVFAWRLLRNWLPTKDDLFRQGILNQDSQHCVSGCGVTESTNHLFLDCKFIGSI